MSNNSSAREIAERLLELIMAVERLIAADDGSQEKCDAIDALYLNFNYRTLRAGIAAIADAEARVRQELEQGSDYARFAAKHPELLAKATAETEADELRTVNTSLSARLAAMEQELIEKQRIIDMYMSGINKP